MEKIHVKDLVEITNGEILCGDANTEIGEVSIDTRTLKNGDTYLALKGETTDGIIYCKDAIEKGAKVCIVEKNIFSQEELQYMGKKASIVKTNSAEDTLIKIATLKRSKYDIPVIGITGSVGKTSTKDIIARVMNEKFKVCKTIGNLNNRIGLPKTIMSLKDHNALVVEMGMNHEGELRELTNIAKPTLCVITNIGTSHIGNLGSRENILKAKLEMLEGMENGKVIINNDNDLLHKWNLEDKQYKKITYGIHEKNSDYVAENIKITENGSEFTVKLKNKNYKFITTKVGEPFILNALCAIAVGMEYDIPIEKMQKAVESAKITANRMDVEKYNNTVIIKDYYNASLESMKLAIEYLAKMKGGKKIAVLGDIKEAGKYSKELHTKVGEEVTKNNVDILITVGMDAEYIANSAIEKGMSKENVFSYRKNIQAVKKLKKIYSSGDKILIKASNGMKFWEIYNGFKTKTKVAVVVGGMSSEHDVSLMSGKSILKNINKEKYDITVIYINENAKVFKYIGDYENIDKINKKDLQAEKNLIEAVKNSDIVFPVLHGKFGEDGCIQGLMEMIKKPYVGCKVFASGACMDKEYTKKLVSLEGIEVAKGIVIRKKEHSYRCNMEKREYKLREVCEKAENELGYPMFVKPAREGSSFGVTRATTREELVEAVKEAKRFDDKILIEQEIVGREIECAVLGNDEIIVSGVGEIKAADNFYSYEAKYVNPKSKTIIPAKVKPEEETKIQEYAEKAYRIVDATGLSRVDFFLKENGEIILNEINTMPGFTQISMYPKLFEEAGIKYSELIDKLIELAVGE